MHTPNHLSWIVLLFLATLAAAAPVRELQPHPGQPGQHQPPVPGPASGPLSQAIGPLPPGRRPRQYAEPAAPRPPGELQARPVQPQPPVPGPASLQGPLSKAVELPPRPGATRKHARPDSSQPVVPQPPRELPARPLAPGPVSLGPLSKPVGSLPPGPRGYKSAPPAIPLHPLPPPPSAVGTTTTGGVSYSLLREATRSEVSSTWSLSDPALLAKRFDRTQQSIEIQNKIKKAYDLESERTSKILRLYPQIASFSPNIQLTGKSKIHGSESDEEYDWLLAPSSNGRGFLSQDGWKQAHARGHRECLALIKNFIRPQFAQHMAQFQQATGLVHTEPDPTRIMWSPDAKKIIGLIGYDKLDEVNGPLYKAAFGRHGASPQATWPQVVRNMALNYFPESLCPDAKPGGKRQRTGPAQR